MIQNDKGQFILQMGSNEHRAIHICSQYGLPELTSEELSYLLYALQATLDLRKDGAE